MRIPLRFEPSFAHFQASLSPFFRLVKDMLERLSPCKSNSSRKKLCFSRCIIASLLRLKDKIRHPVDRCFTPLSHKQDATMPAITIHVGLQICRRAGTNGRERKTEHCRVSQIPNPIPSLKLTACPMKK